MKQHPDKPAAKVTLAPAANQNKEEDCDPEKLSYFALDKVAERMPYGSPESLAELDKDRRAIKCMREWAATQSPCIQTAYEEWLDEKDREMERNEESIRSNRQSEGEKLIQEWREKDMESNEYAKKIKAPAPVRCVQ